MLCKPVFWPAPARGPEFRPPPRKCRREQQLEGQCHTHPQRAPTCTTRETNFNRKIVDFCELFHSVPRKTQILAYKSMKNSSSKIISAYEKIAQ